MFNSKGPEWEWCGYTYHYDVHEEEDNRKIWHEIKDTWGNSLPLKYTTDWSPYRWPTEEQFQTSVVEYMLAEYFKKEKYSVGF